MQAMSKTAVLAKLPIKPDAKELSYQVQKKFGIDETQMIRMLVSKNDKQARQQRHNIALKGDKTVAAAQRRERVRQELKEQFRIRKMNTARFVDLSRLGSMDKFKKRGKLALQKSSQGINEKYQNLVESRSQQRKVISKLIKKQKDIANGVMLPESSNTDSIFGN